MRNLVFMSKCLVEIDTDELIRAKHEAELLAVDDKPYEKVVDIVTDWLMFKKMMVEKAEAGQKKIIVPGQSPNGL